MTSMFSKGRFLCPVPSPFTISRDRTFTTIQVVKPTRHRDLPLNGTMRSGDFSSVSVTGPPEKTKLPLSSVTVPPSRIPQWYNKPTLAQEPQTREYGRFFMMERLGEFDTLQSQKFQIVEKIHSRKKNGKRRTKRFRNKR